MLIKLYNLLSSIAYEPPTMFYDSSGADIQKTNSGINFNFTEIGNISAIFQHMTPEILRIDNERTTF